MTGTEEQESPRRCFVCGKPTLERDQRQTCTLCLGRIRRALIEIEQLYALLPSAVSAGTGGSIAGGRAPSAESPLPGGDALVMLGPGSDGMATAMAIMNYLDDSHADDEYPSDPPAVLAVLGSWEDDWCEVRIDQVMGLQDVPARPAMIMQTVTYLTRRLTWAAQQHDAFDEFAKDVLHLLMRLRGVTRMGDSTERGVPCPYCESERLVRREVKPDPCEPGCDHTGDGHDQGGLRDDWICPNWECVDEQGRRRGFTAREYNLAVWQAWHNRQREAD